MRTGIRATIITAVVAVALAATAFAAQAATLVPYSWYHA
jgi:hypothetical protein